MPLVSMDDLVITGLLSLIGVYLALFLILFAIFSAGRLMYTLVAAGEYGLVISGTLIILAAVSLYLTIGFWLRKTDWI
jgi:hypothetical protein